MCGRMSGKQNDALLLSVWMPYSLDDRRGAGDCRGTFRRSHSMKFLYLDFDSAVDLDALEKQIAYVADLTTVDLAIREAHPTRRGHHVIVAARWRAALDHWQICPTWEDKCHCDPLFECQHNPTPSEVVALQVLLGSDPQREAFNLQRAHVLGDAPEFWRDRWNVLYSEKLHEG